jgi:hypothetical protein
LRSEYLKKFRGLLEEEFLNRQFKIAKKITNKYRDPESGLFSVPCLSRDENYTVLLKRGNFLPLVNISPHQAPSPPADMSDHLPCNLHV